MPLLLPYSTEHVVVGGTIEALAYAYINKYPIVWTENILPHMFDWFPADKDLSPWLMINKQRKLQTTSNDIIKAGSSKSALHAKLQMALSLEGFNLGGNSINNIRVDKKKQELRLFFSTGSREMVVRYKQLHVFDDQYVEGLVYKKKSGQKFEVIDWFHCKNFKLHNFDLIPIGDNFAHRAIFYKSFRSGFIKDMVVISHLTLEEITNSDYSDALIRMKLESIMSELPFYSANRAKRLECHKREMIYKMGPYGPQENIEFHYDDINTMVPQTHMDTYIQLFDER
tara:strand:+ start:16808 stop:17659 length:852 start_codon:yes stop_codon:yes gene_type:complete